MVSGEAVVSVGRAVVSMVCPARRISAGKAVVSGEAVAGTGEAAVCPASATCGRNERKHRY